MVGCQSISTHYPCLASFSIKMKYIIYPIFFILFLLSMLAYCLNVMLLTSDFLKHLPINFWKIFSTFPCESKTVKIQSSIHRNYLFRISHLHPKIWEWVSKSHKPFSFTQFENRLFKIKIKSQHIIIKFPAIILILYYYLYWYWGGMWFQYNII